jgi:CheY-like chemotaxis protein
VADDLPRYMRGDDSKLRQVLINLLANGVKFTEHGRITLRVFGRDDRVFFEVEDTGPGIEEAEQEVIFDAFKQADTGLRSGQGTGLGLTISRDFVRLMGGDIVVKSTVGQGATFSFDIRLPAARGSKPVAEEHRVIGLEPGQPSYRILVADDRWENRAFLAKMLSPLGFEVREANDGREVLELWNSWDPHLIWMDIRMPFIDGLEAIRKIRAAEAHRHTNAPDARLPGGENATELSERALLGTNISPLSVPREGDLPIALPRAKAEESMEGVAPVPASPSSRRAHCVIIALTASAFGHDRAEILAAGCDDFISKPFRNTTVFEKLGQHLGVRFIREPEHPAAPAAKNGPVLIPNQLKELPAEYLAQLRHALTIGDDQAAHQVLDRIRPCDEPLVAELMKMVKKFQFEELSHLLKGVLE